MVKRWHEGGNELSRELKTLMAVLGECRADNEGQGGGVNVVFMHSTRRANKWMQAKKIWVIKALVHTKGSDLMMFIC